MSTHLLIALAEEVLTPYWNLENKWDGQNLQGKFVALCTIVIYSKKNVINSSLEIIYLTTQ